MPPWRREAGVIAWESAIAFAAVRLATGRNEPAAAVAIGLGLALFLGARVFFVLRDGGWLPGARELAKSSALRGAVAPLTWPIGALTFPFALLAMVHEALFVTAPFLFRRNGLVVLALAVAGFVAVLASR